MIREILDGKMRLPLPEQWESRLLDTYRLSDWYRVQFGQYLWDHERDGALMRRAVSALKEQQGLREEDPLDLDICREQLLDLAYTMAVLGYRPWEYFTYHFKNRSIMDRLSFFPEEKYTFYYSVLNDSSQFMLLDDKYQTFEALKPYYKRDAAPARDAGDLDAFLRFYEAHDRFVVKPLAGTFGTGIRIVEKNPADDPRQLFRELIRTEPYLCEEYIVSHANLAQFHPRSLNTLRVFTYYDRESGTGPEIMCAWMKAGVGDAAVDNAHAGGLVAAMDPDTGVVISDGADETGRLCAAHPDTGIVFKGFQVEAWEECKAFCREIAKQFPTMRLVGWDVARSVDRGWMVVEGNPRGMFLTLQNATQKGMRKEFLEKIHWEMHTKKSGVAVFARGVDFRDRVKALAGGSENVRAIRRASSPPAELRLTELNNGADPMSPEPITIWFDSGTVYYCTAARRPRLNQNPSAMFQNLSGLEKLDLSGVQSGDSIYFDHLFHGCSRLRSLDLSGLETDKVRQMNAMFCGCTSLEELILGSMNTARVKNMSRMFFGCRSLRHLDLSGFDTNMAENCSEMFAGCASLEALDLSRFSTARMKTMSRIFKGCERLRTIGVPGFRVPAGTDLSEMFSGCAALADGQDVQIEGDRS